MYGKHDSKIKIRTYMCYLWVTIARLNAKLQFLLGGPGGFRQCTLAEPIMGIRKTILK